VLFFVVVLFNIIIRTLNVMACSS